MSQDSLRPPPSGGSSSPSPDGSRPAGTLTLIEKTVFLKSVEVLSGIPTEAVAQLAARSTEVRAEPNEVLFRVGEEDQGTFIVVEGLVELQKEGTLIRVLKQGSAHGELFLGENEPHQYSAVAREPSLLLNLRQSDVVDALLEYPEFGLAMVHDLALRMHKLTQRVIELEAAVKAQAPERDPVREGEAIEPA
jgi:CRP-like cAMP-binding protein